MVTPNDLILSVKFIKIQYFLLEYTEFVSFSKTFTEYSIFFIENFK
jgi:hypothetical protein